ncbi:MAG TPA: glycine cleavage system protein H, partial [Thermoanaerobaculia bacterium]|nr:glycine cleavage system protein H [Thermoanaerobaculia bacterium]
MNETELLSPYTAKAMEYLLAVSYLLLFIPFWRFVQGEAAPAHALGFGWFQVPNGVHLHAGHTWARPEGGDVEVGLDDFAHKL